jgi:coenzyme F420-reducing hydrogenase delta subunit/ferredoxin
MTSDASRKPTIAGDGDWKPRIVAMICNWCTYAGADMAGTTRRAYPASVRALRVPCTGRIDPLLVVKAFEQGADGVVVSGCHPGDCHYVQGNLVARRRFAALRAALSLLGLDERRLHFAWVSASEGAKWARLVEEVTAAVRAAGPFAGWGAAVDGTPAPMGMPAPPPPPREPARADEQEAIAGHLRTLAAKLLAEGTVETVIGYTAGPLPGQLVPAFVSDGAEVGKLEWGGYYAVNDQGRELKASGDVVERLPVIGQPRNNLAVYLAGGARQRGKLAVVVKRCDARAVVGLLQENQVERESVVLIGVSCGGVEHDGELAMKCYACDGEVPPQVDWTVSAAGATAGAVPSGAPRPVAADPREAQLAWLEALPAAERWAWWRPQLERCLRCYGCRAVCPLCYCTTCVAEKNQPQWIPTAIGTPANLSWNVVRALHLAGRCGGCDECARVCPADVRLDLLNHRLAREIESRFDYRSGEDPAAAPPLAAFRPDDAQEFIR